MWESEVSTDIMAPAEEVYRYLVDFPRHNEWSCGVDEVTPVTGHGRIEVDSEFEAHETVPAKFASHTRITTLDPPRRIAWDSSDRRMMSVQWAFELNPVDGVTHLVQRSRWQPTNILCCVVFNVMRKRRIPKENRQSLERIKAILEGRSA